MLDFLSKLATKTDVKTDSGAGQVNKQDFKSLLQHAAIVGLASAATVIAANISNVDFGSYAVILIPIISSGLSILQKWAADNTKQ